MLIWYIHRKCWAWFMANLGLLIAWNRYVHCICDCVWGQTKTCQWHAPIHVFSGRGISTWRPGPPMREALIQGNKYPTKLILFCCSFSCWMLALNPTASLSESTCGTCWSVLTNSFQQRSCLLPRIGTEVAPIFSTVDPVMEGCVPPTMRLTARTCSTRLCPG